MGEPTLHPDFFEILDYAQEKKVNVGLTTNGTGLTGKTGQRLLDYGLYQIDISLQTPDEKSYRLRKAGSLSFDEYIDGILGFFSNYQKRWEETIFKFRFLNTRFSSKEMNKKIDSIKINSSNKDLRNTFASWADRIYDILGVNGEERERAVRKIHRLVSYKWNVVEVYRNVFFETYLLNTWKNAYKDPHVRDAWAGFCPGMQDHFGILYNGDVVLCCIDFDGNTSIGNVNNSSLREILSSPELGNILRGFRKFRVIHPYCKKCLGSKSFTTWMFKPFGLILSLKVLKPFFYTKTSLWQE